MPALEDHSCCCESSYACHSQYCRHGHYVTLRHIESQHALRRRLPRPGRHVEERDARAITNNRRRGQHRPVLTQRHSRRPRSHLLTRQQARRRERARAHLVRRETPEPNTKARVDTDHDSLCGDVVCRLAWSQLQPSQLAMQVWRHTRLACVTRVCHVYFCDQCQRWAHCQTCAINRLWERAYSFTTARLQLAVRAPADNT